MTDQASPNFNFATSPSNDDVDPSVAYAEAVLNGEKKVTVVRPDGQALTYQIGKEYNY